MPAMNTPSDAKSTGLNFTCASRKNPSASSETLNNFATSCASSRGTTGMDNTSKSGCKVIDPLQGGIPCVN